jgi:hypothetical protein
MLLLFILLKLNTFFLATKKTVFQKKIRIFNFVKYSMIVFPSSECNFHLKPEVATFRRPRNPRVTLFCNSGDIARHKYSSVPGQGDILGRANFASFPLDPTVLSSQEIKF